jgi:hypothetical protein
VPLVPVGIGLHHERVRIVETEENGQPVVGKFYLRGPYAMTIGRALWFRGSADDRDYVQSASAQVMQRIISLSQESRHRLDQARRSEPDYLSWPAWLAA